MIGPAKKKLLRAVATPDKILNVQLPPTTFWLDANLAVVRSRVEMPNLGVLRLDRVAPPSRTAAVLIDLRGELAVRVLTERDEVAV